MPTFIHGKNTAVYIDEFDLSSYFNDVSVSLDNDVAETTAFGDTNKAFILGTRGGTLSMSGMWASDTDGSDEELIALLGNATTPILTVRQGAAAIGSRAIIAQANETSYAITNPVADVATVVADFECTPNQVSNLTFALAGGVQLTAGASIAHGSLGDLSSVDNAASSANGGAGTLHVPTNTVNGNTTIKIQHSANRYLRATASTAGSSGSITFMVAFARF